MARQKNDHSQHLAPDAQNHDWQRDAHARNVLKVFIGEQEEITPE